MSFVPFQAAAEVGDRFLDLLHRHDINPRSGSDLEDELLSLTRLIEVTKNPALAQGSDEAAILRSAFGLYDLAAKVLAVEPIAEFSTFLPHLRLIAEKGVPAASLGQNAASGPFDDTARKMAELYLGSLAAHVGSDVELDSPTNAKGDNPDVLFTLDEHGPSSVRRRWALAIKTISSRHGQTIFERIKEGAAQIDAPDCPADRGMVVINTKSALDHDALWNASFPDLASAGTALVAQINALSCAAGADRPQAEWDALFVGKTVRPVLFLGQSLVCLPTLLSRRTPTALKVLVAYDADGTLDPTAGSLSFVMNGLMQTIRLGIPGTVGNPGQPPR